MNVKILTDIMQEIFSSLVKSDTVSHVTKQLEAVYKRVTTHFDIKDEFGMDEGVVQMLRPVFRFLYDNWWRVEVEGVKNIPSKGAALIVANHSGMLPFDAVMLNMAVFAEHSENRNVRFLVADFIDNFPLLSLFIQRAGGVKASPENAVKLLKKGELVCAFPEGTNGIGKLYSERYKLQEFGKGGVVRIARQTGAPVIPCAIIGAEETYPIMWKLEDIGKKMGLPFFPVTPTFPLFGLIGLIPLPSKWKIIFGKPIRYKPSKKSAEALATELKEKVQQMINKELIKRA